MRTCKHNCTHVRPPKLNIQLRLLLYVMTLIFGGLSLTAAVGNYFYEAVNIVIYVIAACSVACTCYYLYYDVKYGYKDKLKPAIEGNEFTNKMYKDYRYRTVLATLFAFLVNMFYAVSNGIFGIVNHSAWFGTLAAYYGCLSVMRFSILWYRKIVPRLGDGSERKLHELKVCSRCGMLLILITVALCGAVVLMVHSEGGKSYPGSLIFAVAAYTFFKAIVSVINLVKAAKLNSPLLVTIRNIGYADALVSILSLQTAMFVSFGEGGNLDAQLMNGITGAVICTVILLIGIYLIVMTGKKMEQLQQER